MSILSTNPEDRGSDSDNKIEITIPIDFDHSLGLLGQTDPEQIDFSTTKEKLTDLEKFEDRDIGPLVSHMYQVGTDTRF